MTSPAATPLKTAFDTARGGLLITDLTAKILYANDAIARHTGFSIAEMVGKRPNDLWGGHMDREFYQRLWRAIKEERAPFISPVENVRKRHQKVRDVLHLAPIVDATGAPRYFIEVLPGSAGNAAESAFQHAFAETFAGDGHAKRVSVEHLYRLVSEFSDALAPDALTGAHSAPPDLASTLNVELILPVEAHFSARGDDRVLVEAAQRDPRAFASLYAKYHDAVHKHLWYRVNLNHETAEDLTQETFVHAFRHLGAFRFTNASYLTYLCRIAHNLLISHYRSEYRLRREEEKARQSEVVNTDDHLPAHDLDWFALKKLPTIQREVVTLKYGQDLSVEEIASELHKSPNAIKLHLSRARKNLRHLLAAE